MLNPPFLLFTHPCSGHTDPFNKGTLKSIALPSLKSKKKLKNYHLLYPVKYK